MKVSLDAIKALREQTRASLNDCRAALESSGGNQQKALEWLRQRGAQIAKTRQGRVAAQGRVESYVHHDGRLGVIVEVNCETDFVARTPEFVQFCRDVAMHVAAMDPRGITPEEATDGTPRGADASSSALLTQPFVKDQGTTVGDLLKTLIAKTGENVVIRRFTRFAVGDTAAS